VHAWLLRLLPLLEVLLVLMHTARLTSATPTDLPPPHTHTHTRPASDPPQAATCQLLTIDVIDCEGGPKVAEHGGKDTPGLHPNEGDWRLVSMANLVDAFALLKAGVCQDNHLQERMHTDARSTNVVGRKISC
jgi:hypothetical protein